MRAIGAEEKDIVIVALCSKFVSQKRLFVWMALGLTSLPRNVSSNIKIREDRMMLNIEDTLTLAKLIYDRSNRAVIFSEQLLPQLEHISRLVGNTLEQTEKIMSHVELLNSQSMTTSTNQRARLRLMYPIKNESRLPMAPNHSGNYFRMSSLIEIEHDDLALSTDVSPISTS